MAPSVPPEQENLLKEYCRGTDFYSPEGKTIVKVAHEIGRVGDIGYVYWIRDHVDELLSKIDNLVHYSFKTEDKSRSDLCGLFILTVMADLKFKGSIRRDIGSREINKSFCGAVKKQIAEEFCRSLPHFGLSPLDKMPMFKAGIEDSYYVVFNHGALIDRIMMNFHNACGNVKIIVQSLGAEWVIIQRHGINQENREMYEVIIKWPLDVNHSEREKMRTALKAVFSLIFNNNIHEVEMRK